LETQSVISKLEGREDALAVSTLTFSGAGLAALPKKMVERILAKEYIDFDDLPSAKGKLGWLWFKLLIWCSQKDILWTWLPGCSAMHSMLWSWPPTSQTEFQNLWHICLSF